MNGEHGENELKIGIVDPNFFTPRANANSNIVILQNQVRALARQGNKLTIFAPQETSRYSDDFDVVRIAGRLSTLKSLFSPQGSQIPFLSGFFSPDFILKIIQYLRRNQDLDVIYSCGTPFSAVISSLIGRSSGIPSAHYSTSYLGAWRWWRGDVDALAGFDVPLKKIVRQVFVDAIRELPRRQFVMKWGLSASNGLMASSKFGKNNLDGLGLKTETIPVVYPPVEIPPIDTEKGSELRVTYFGHLWQGRGILDLATAFSMIPSEVDARLVIAANNTHELTRSYLDQIIARSKISQNVTRLGVVKDTFREILIPSLIIALPYRDTPSIKLLEAMAAGRAVVTTKLGWSPEVIVDGENGFMVQVGNIKELANRLVSLLRDPSFARQIGERGQVTIRRMCDPGKHAEQVTEVLKSAAKSL